MSQSEILVEKKNEISVIYLNGYFDIEVKDIILEKIDKLLNSEEKKYLFNFSETDKINSMGMAVIIEAVDVINTNSGVIGYCELSRQNAKLLKRIGLTKFGKIYKTEEDGLNDL